MSDDELLDPPEKDPLIFRAWRWWKVVWAVLRNFLEIGVILLAFGKLSTAFENIVLSLLVLIFQSLTMGGAI
jgi:hypothetical protein